MGVFGSTGLVVLTVFGVAERAGATVLPESVPLGASVLVLTAALVFSLLGSTVVDCPDLSVTVDSELLVLYLGSTNVEPFDPPSLLSDLEYPYEYRLSKCP